MGSCTNIGIGITTTPNRKEFLELCVKQIEKHTKRYNLFIHEDKEYKGVAYSKNKCLDALKSYDHIFLFDDDCFPKSDEWVEYFLSDNPPEHLMYLNNWGKIKALPDDGNGFIPYNNCSGCMMYLTRKVVETVGLMDESYGRYGYEHADYSLRIHNAGFTPTGPFLSPAGAEGYIHSLDYDGPFLYDDKDGCRTINPTPSISIKDAQTALEISGKHFRSKWGQ